MSKLVVNRDEILQISSDLIKLAGMMGALRDWRKRVQGEIEQPDMRDAIQEFEDDWSEARKAIESSLRTLGQSWYHAAEYFADVDIEISIEAAYSSKSRR